MTSTLNTSEESYSPEVGAAGSERHAKIQTRAYELYIARGEQSGGELDDWLRAELEVDNQ
jgi:hypothetical protein